MFSFLVGLLAHFLSKEFHKLECWDYLIKAGYITKNFSDVLHYLAYSCIYSHFFSVPCVHPFWVSIFSLSFSLSSFDKHMERQKKASELSQLQIVLLTTYVLL